MEFPLGVVESTMNRRLLAIFFLVPAVKASMASYAEYAFPLELPDLLEDLLLLDDLLLLEDFPAVASAKQVRSTIATKITGVRMDSWQKKCEEGIHRASQREIRCKNNAQFPNPIFTSHPYTVVDIEMIPDSTMFLLQASLSLALRCGL